MSRKSHYDLAHVCTLVLVPGMAAWALGKPMIFPSLGPSAFALVLDGNENGAWRVVGGHLVGVLSGLLAYHVIAHGLGLASLSPALGFDGLRIVASGTTSIALTVVGMWAARASHAPACATTLIVSLGVLPGLVDGMLIMSAVTGMFLTHRLVMLVRR